MNDKVLQSAICFEHIQIYEFAKEISDEMLIDKIELPIHELRGFRNHIVHEYGNVDYSIVYNSSKSDVPVLLEKLKTFTNKL